MKAGENGSKLSHQAEPARPLLVCSKHPQKEQPQGRDILLGANDTEVSRLFKGLGYLLAEAGNSLEEARRQRRIAEALRYHGYRVNGRDDHLLLPSRAALGRGQLSLKRDDARPELLVLTAARRASGGRDRHQVRGEEDLMGE